MLFNLGLWKSIYGILKTDSVPPCRLTGPYPHLNIDLPAPNLSTPPGVKRIYISPPPNTPYPLYRKPRAPGKVCLPPLDADTLLPFSLQSLKTHGRATQRNASWARRLQKLCEAGWGGLVGVVLLVCLLYVWGCRLGALGCLGVWSLSLSSPVWFCSERALSGHV